MLAGSLHHVSEVGEATLGPGDVQRLTAGTGVVHAETSADAGGVTRFVQTWLRPAAPGLRPSYQLVRGALRDCGTSLVPLDLGLGSTARLHLGRVPEGGSVDLPQAAPLLHVLVASGDAGLVTDGGEVAVGPGDAVRLQQPERAQLRAVTPVVALVWVTD